MTYADSATYAVAFTDDLTDPGWTPAVEIFGPLGSNGEDYRESTTHELDSLTDISDADQHLEMLGLRRLGEWEKRTSTDADWIPGYVGAGITAWIVAVEAIA